MYFLNCVNSLKTCSGYANYKRNTILRYWCWIHFVIWSSVYALRISQYSFLPLPSEIAREKGCWGWVIRFILKNCCKTLLLLNWLKASMQSLYFKGASTLQRIVKRALWKVHHLQRVIKCGLLKGYKQLLNFKYKIAHSVHFPLKLSLIFTYSPFFFFQYMKTYILVYLLICLLPYFTR